MGVGIIERQDPLGQVQSLVKAFNILDALRCADNGLTLTEVAGLAGLPRSTAHRLLATMNAMRYVEFDPSCNRWLVGLQAFALGASFMQNRDVARLGRPIMRCLMNDTGETVNIGNTTSEGLTYIAQVRPQSDSGTAAPTGAVMPLNTTASGKALLAFRTPAQIDRYLSETALDRGTGLAPATPGALTAELERVRGQGFAIDDQEHRAGIRCIAAPVYDRSGTARLSLSISGHAARLTDQRIARLSHILTGAAARMSSEIGGLLAA